MKVGTEGSDGGAPKLKISLKPPSSSSAGVSVDNEALRRQQDLVRAGSSKTPLSASNPVGNPNNVSNPTKVESQSTPSVSAASPAPQTSTVKVEPKRVSSPMPGSVTVASQPGTLGHSSTPIPSNVVTMPPPKMPTPQPYSRPAIPPATSALDSKFRKPGKGKLLFEVTLASLTNIRTQ